jgi:hypothetical protein
VDLDAHLTPALTGPLCRLSVSHPVALATGSGLQEHPDAAAATDPGGPATAAAEDDGVHNHTQANAGKDLRQRVITDLVPGPGNHGHQRHTTSNATPTTGSSTVVAPAVAGHQRRRRDSADRPARNRASNWRSSRRSGRSCTAVPSRAMARSSGPSPEVI